MAPATLRIFSIILLWLASQALQASELERHMRAVEEIRGLSFKGEVNTVTIDRSELPARLREQVARSLPYSADEWTDLLQALLLLAPGGDAPFDSLIELYQSQVLAYYDPHTRTYYALRQPPPALQKLPGGIAPEEGVIVHELVHALQDQHFDIGRRDRTLRRNTDAAMAYHALLEGEASLVMLAHLIGQTGADFDTLIRQPIFDGLLTSTAAADLTFDAGTPRYFAESLKFPYLGGLRFVLEAYRRGGWAELDRVHADPPRSTREILHPLDYFERQFRPNEFVAHPPLPVRPLAVEHLGEFHWAFLVGAENALGWRGDRATVVQDGLCLPTVLIETSWDSEEAARRFHSAYAGLLDERGFGFVSRVDGKDVRLAYGADTKLMDLFLP